MFIPIGSNLPYRRFPKVTIGWFVVCLFLFVGLTRSELQTAFEASQEEEATVSIEGTMTYDLAVVPKEENSFLNFVSYQFMHASWGHLISNMWFLAIFGWLLEAAIGGVWFLALTLLIGAIAVIPEIYLQSDPSVPIIGASGSVAFMMGAIFAMFPRARSEFVLLFMPGSFFVPIRYLVYFWVSMQISGLAMHLWVEPKPVAYATHLTGFALGMLIGLFYRQKKRSEPFFDVELSGPDLHSFYRGMKAFQERRFEEASESILRLSENRPWMINLQLQLLLLAITHEQRELADRIWRVSLPGLISLRRVREVEGALLKYRESFEAWPPLDLDEKAKVSHLIQTFSPESELVLQLDDSKSAEKS